MIDTQDKREAQSKSGPQTPVARRPSHFLDERRRQASETNLAAAASAPSEPLATGSHQSKCVFERLIAQENNNNNNSAPRARQHQQPAAQLHHDQFLLPDETPSPPLDAHRQYVAVQQGCDIPLRGLRKPLPEPNLYRGEYLANNFTLVGENLLIGEQANELGKIA